MVKIIKGKTHNMDCLDGLKLLPDCCVDLTVTSPPYDNLRNYNGFSFDFEPIAEELFRVTKKGGVVVWIVADGTMKGSESGTSFRQALYFKEIGFNLHDTMIFAKNNPVPLSHNRYEQQFEYMFVLSKGKPKTFNALTVDCTYAGEKRNEKNRLYRKDASAEMKIGKTIPVKNKRPRRNIWFYNVGKMQSAKDKVAFEHPALFPEELAEDHILSWSNEGDLVMDIFSGSGTTHKMALKNKREFIGFEISDKYVSIENERISNFEAGTIH